MYFFSFPPQTPLSSEAQYRQTETLRINRIIEKLPTLVVLVGVVAVLMGYVMGVVLHT
jgi:hypothetical protein